jgi:hypothetical protein
MKKLALLAAFAVVAFNSNAADITGLYNTGFGSTTDSHYTVDGHAAYIASNELAFPISAPWSHNTETSKWLTPTANQGESLDPSVDKTYSYALTFTLNGAYDWSTASFSGRFAADNAAVAYLNGHQIGTTTGFGEADWSSFTTNASYFVAGVNTITFDVTNWHKLIGNPTGLRVEFDASNITAVPEAETYAMMLAGLGMLGFAARRRQAK